MPDDKTRPILKTTMPLSSFWPCQELPLLTGCFSFYKEKNAGNFVDFSWVKNEKPLEIKRFFGDLAEKERLELSRRLPDLRP